MRLRRVLERRFVLYLISVLLNAHFCLVYVSRLFFQVESLLGKNEIFEEAEDNVNN